MAVSIPNQYPVILTREQRERFEEITRKGRPPAKKTRHAQILLLSDRNRMQRTLDRRSFVSPRSQKRAKGSASRCVGSGNRKGVLPPCEQALATSCFSA